MRESQADVQLEHGHVRIANRLYEALLDAGFTATQFKILHGLIRLTYGWRQKTVSISHAELASIVGVSPSGTFRSGLRELVTHGVVLLLDPGGGADRATLAIQKDFTKWGKFALHPDRLAARYDTRPQSHDELLPTLPKNRQGATPQRIEQGAGKQAGSMPVNGQGGCRKVGRGTPPKCDTPSQLAAPKDSERQERQKEPKATRGARYPWLDPYNDIWKARYGGDMKHGRDAAAISQLEKAHGRPEVLRRWALYIAAEPDGRYTVASTFASTWDQWGRPRPTLNGGKVVAADDAGEILTEIRGLVQTSQPPGQSVQRFIRKVDVERLGAAVLEAYERSGGSDRVIAAVGDKYGLLLRDFTRELAASRRKVTTHAG